VEYFFAVMKKAAKKIPRNFRLDAAINKELVRRSELIGIPETRILEDALRNHFYESMHRQLTQTLRKFPIKVISLRK
jgi:hypothetical protein